MAIKTGSSTVQPNLSGVSFHSSPAAEVIGRLATDIRVGLSEEIAAQRSSEFGKNELARETPVPAWRKLIAQFESPMIGLLASASIISGLVGEWLDACAILFIVALNGALGYLQEAKAEKALASLQTLTPRNCRILRRGKIRELSASELAPGDIVLLEAGDNVPADLRLIESFSFRVQQATITGESEPVPKEAGQALPESTPLGDRANMVYLGSTAVAGKAKGIVVQIGMGTELGQIARLIRSTRPEPTPLQQNLAQVGRTLAKACVALSLLIFGLQLWNGRPFHESLLIATSLAVAAVPEGLPAIVTVSLALGLQRMAQRNALIRKLTSVETLGCVTVICTDKTGTLTKNEMTVCEVITADWPIHVGGVGYAPHGDFSIGDRNNDQRIIPSHYSELIEALRIGVICNNSTIEPSAEDATQWNALGDPTECALITAGLKGGIDRDSASFALEHELPFDSDRKAMSIIGRFKDGRRMMFTKGAVEKLLDRCTRILSHDGPRAITGKDRARILDSVHEMASRALRVLLLAERSVDDADREFAEADLTLVALVGMIDPPREEAKQSVALCRQAGITPVMITGDHPRTAFAIGSELGIAKNPDDVVTGEQLEKMTDHQLDEKVVATSVFARVTALDKLRIVNAWKRIGHVVAMTGDGVNDAPAVKTADIGISMGRKGTDVTREASSMVLLDDNFASIVNAVEEGRTIYANIRKFLVFLLSCNIGEMLLMLCGSLLGWPTPLVPVQLLWVNIVTDGLAALALAMEPAEPDVMSHKPRPARSQVLTARLGKILLGQGVLIAAVALIAFGVVYSQDGADLVRARTIAFCVLVFAELARAFAVRSPKWTFFQLGITTNLYLVGALFMSALVQCVISMTPSTRVIFQMSPLSSSDWAFIVGLSLAPVTILELLKLINQRIRPT